MQIPDFASFLVPGDYRIRRGCAAAPIPHGREGDVGRSAYNFKELRASRNQEQMAGIGQLPNLP